MKKVKEKIKVKSKEKWGAPKVSIPTLINEGYTFSSRELYVESSSSITPMGQAPTISEFEINMYFSPKITSSFDKSGFIVNLYFQVENKYYSYQESYFIKTSKRRGNAANYKIPAMPKDQKPSCQYLQIRLSPNSTGGFNMLTDIKGDEVFGIIENKNKVVQEGNNTVNTVGYYDCLNPDKILKSVQSKIKAWTDFPPVILPLSNVYIYKGMNFKAPLDASDYNAVVSVQAAYGPKT